MPTPDMPKNSDPDELPLERHDDCEALTELTLEHLPQDSSFGRRRKYPKNSYIWRPDDQADRIYLLRRGQVAALISDSAGNEVLLRVIDAGQPFGELCFCSEKDGLRGNSARAIIESEALEVEFSAFLAHLQENREALLAFVFTFCKRLAETERRIEVLSHRGAEDRLTRLLLQLAAARGKPSARRKNDVMLVVSHDELALMAAMSRPHVSVTMAKLRRRGLVHYERGSQLHVNIALLKSLVNTPRNLRSRD